MTTVTRFQTTQAQAASISGPAHFDAELNNPNRRIMKTLNFGVEIELAEISVPRMLEVMEVFFGRGQTSVRSHQGNYSRGVKDDQGRMWFAMTDGSIRSRSGRGAELVTPPLAYADIPVLQELLRRLRQAGGRANSSTGIHIHIGLDRQDGSTALDIGAIKRWIKNTSKFEYLMRQALQIDASRLNTYTRPIREDIVADVDRVRNLDDLNRLVFRRGESDFRNNHVRSQYEIGRYPRERYQGMNLVNIWRIGTIEGRWFNGTTNAGTLRAYITLMLALAEKAITTTRASSTPRVIEAGNEKYAVRTWLIQLGLIGDEFKTVRSKLTKHLNGNASWVHGRPEAVA